MNNSIPMPDELKELLSDLLGSSYRLVYKGEPVQFQLKKNQSPYLYYRAKSGKLFCYTPHPSTKGDYFIWTYIPKGKGARSGDPERYLLRDLARCAKRKTAKAKALARYYKDNGRPDPLMNFTGFSLTEEESSNE